MKWAAELSRVFLLEIIWSIIPRWKMVFRYQKWKADGHIIVVVLSHLFFVQEKPDKD